jgi:hypothetical protein
MKKLLLVVLCSAPLLTLAAEGSSMGSPDAAPQGDTAGAKASKKDAKHKKTAKKGKHAKKGEGKMQGEGMHGGSMEHGEQKQQ